ncbi:MAG: hypothetical protein WCE87_11410, partial [Candidatus Udaeobacter sp.]
MMMDTKVAKITRSLTLPVMSCPNALRGPGRSRRSPPGAQSVSFCLNGLHQAAPSRDFQCFRFEAGRPDGRDRIPLVGQYFLIATENLIDAGDTSVQNSWIAR